jgi:hypothetical protein
MKELRALSLGQSVDRRRAALDRFCKMASGGGPESRSRGMSVERLVPISKAKVPEERLNGNLTTSRNLPPSGRPD